MRSVWRLAPTVILVSGAVLLAAAYAYQAHVVGPMYLDPTPAEAAKQAHDVQVAEGLAFSGLCATAAGLLLVLGAASVRRLLRARGAGLPPSVPPRHG